MAIDREATLKQAEKLLRQGKLDGAIAEYVRLIEEQPRDWNAINALGDLYVRAGDIDRAVEQFTKIADYLFGEGFLPKAAALYKKALKIKSDHDHTLVRLSEIATQQGLLADARNYLRHLGRQRRDRGDARGAAECLVRLALLDEADAESMLAGARAAQLLGDVPQAVALFRSAAAERVKGGRQSEALDALSEAAALAPGDLSLRRQLAREYVAAGQLDRARAVLNRESAGADPELLLALGRMELASGNEEEARAVFTRLVAIAPDRSAALLGLADELCAAGNRDGGFLCAEIVVDDALLAADWDRALDGLRTFLAHGPHLAALMKLVELAVDAGRDDVMYDAQQQLADAYLAAGRGAEARVIAEDLVARDPASDAHVDRLRRALALVGVADAEAIINRYREPAASADPFDVEFGEPVVDEIVEPPAAPAEMAPVEETAAPPDVAAPPEVAPLVPAAATAAAPAPIDDDAIVLDTLEIDLSEALASLGASSPVLPPPPVTPSEEPVAPPPDLESVFGEMRARAAREQQGSDPADQYERALRHLEEGRRPEAISELQAAARAPQLRFKASARLGRLFIGSGDLHNGIDWLERAAEAPAPAPDEGVALLYDLAGALERAGETARALAILMEIDADGTAYRDVRERIESLVRSQAGERP